MWHIVIYCCFAGWPIYWIKYFSRFSRLYSFDHIVMYFQVCYVKMYRFGSLWMVRVSLLLVSQFFPCKQGHCGVPSKMWKCIFQKGKILKNISIAIHVAFATSPALKLIQLILFNAISSRDGWLSKNDSQTWVSRNCLVIFGFLMILEWGPGWFLVTLSNHLFCPFLWPISRSTFRVLLWDFIHHSTSDRFTF